MFATAQLLGHPDPFDVHPLDWMRFAPGPYPAGSVSADAASQFEDRCLTNPSNVSHVAADSLSGELAGYRLYGAVRKDGGLCAVAIGPIGTAPLFLGGGDMGASASINRHAIPQRELELDGTGRRSRNEKGYPWTAYRCRAEDEWKRSRNFQVQGGDRAACQIVGVP